MAMNRIPKQPDGSVGTGGMWVSGWQPIWDTDVVRSSELRTFHLPLLERSPDLCPRLLPWGGERALEGERMREDDPIRG